MSSVNCLSEVIGVGSLPLLNPVLAPWRGSRHDHRLPSCSVEHSSPSVSSRPYGDQEGSASSLMMSCASSSGPWVSQSFLSCPGCIPAFPSVPICTGVWFGIHFHYGTCFISEWIWTSHLLLGIQLMKTERCTYAHMSVYTQMPLPRPWSMNVKHQQSLIPVYQTLEGLLDNPLLCLLKLNLPAYCSGFDKNLRELGPDSPALMGFLIVLTCT